MSLREIRNCCNYAVTQHNNPPGPVQVIHIRKQEIFKRQRYDSAADENVCHQLFGHFAKDKLIIHGVEKEAAGGAVYYGAIALAKLGFRTGIITMLAKEDYPALDIFARNGVEVFASEAQATSGIKNTYSSENNLNERTCEPIAFAGEFREKQIPDIETKVFHIGPIMAGEVSLELIEYITERFDKVALDLQGVLRVRSGKDLIFVDWSEKELGLRRIHTIKADSVEEVSRLAR